MTTAFPICSAHLQLSDFQCLKIQFFTCIEVQEFQISFCALHYHTRAASDPPSIRSSNVALIIHSDISIPIQKPKRPVTQASPSPTSMHAELRSAAAHSPSLRTTMWRSKNCFITHHERAQGYLNLSPLFLEYVRHSLHSYFPFDKQTKKMVFRTSQEKDIRSMPNPSQPRTRSHQLHQRMLYTQNTYSAMLNKIYIYISLLFFVVKRRLYNANNKFPIPRKVRELI
jgi:hypothetical protein